MQNERCPHKNIRLLGDRPLLQYELESLKQTGLCDRIIVYCSDEAVIPYLPDGVEFLQRPASLDLPTANFSQIMQTFIIDVDADVYVYAHATAPFIKVATMRDCIEAVRSGRFDSAFCAKRIQTFLWRSGQPLNFDPQNLPRTQDLTPIYQETSGVYVFTKDTYKKYGQRVGHHPFIKEVNFKEAIDIDHPEDFILAETLLNISF